jgi:hypothetical protein
LGAECLALRLGDFLPTHFAKLFDRGYKNWDQIHVEFNQKHLKLAHILLFLINVPYF